MWLSKLSRWFSAMYSLIDHIRGGINTSVEFLWCVWYWANKNCRLRRAVVQICDVCCRHWLAVMGYCWARLKMKMCKFKELLEPQEWKQLRMTHKLTCFLLQEQQITWAQKHICLNALFTQYWIWDIQHLHLTRKSIAPLLHHHLLVSCFSSPALRRETGVRRWATVIKRSNWK